MAISLIPSHSSHRRFGSDAGSGLTELALVAPLFIAIVMWSGFFADFGIVTMKVEEASRFAVWEMTAQRNSGVVAKEVKERFADLSSVTRDAGTTPKGIRSFQTINFTTMTVADKIDAKFGGRLAPPSGGAGILGKILTWVNGVMNRAVDASLKAYHFDTTGAAQSQIQVQVTNNIFPKGAQGIWGALFTSDLRQPIAYPKLAPLKSPELLVDTWKAWPGKYAISSQSTDTAPQNTYGNPPDGSAGAAEKEVAARLHGPGGKSGVAFPFVPSSWKNGINRVLSFLRFPSVTLDESFDKQVGPVTMLPGEKPPFSWVPDPRVYQRIGKEYHSSTAANSMRYPAEPAVEYKDDRSRYTTPAKFNTVWWTANGGLGGANKKPNIRSNPYDLMYKCRGYFYMGSAGPSSTRGEVKSYGVSNYGAAAFPRCAQ